MNQSLLASEAEAAIEQVEKIIYLAKLGLKYTKGVSVEFCHTKRPRHCGVMDESGYKKTVWPLSSPPGKGRKRNKVIYTDIGKSDLSSVSVDSTFVKKRSCRKKKLPSKYAADQVLLPAKLRVKNLCKARRCQYTLRQKHGHGHDDVNKIVDAAANSTVVKTLEMTPPESQPEPHNTGEF